MYCDILTPNASIRFFYEQKGQGMPILILPGFTLPYHTAMIPLEEGFNFSQFLRIYVDLPGSGLTEGLPNPINADVVLDLLLLFIDSVIGTNNFLLVGFSYGAYLIQGILARKFDQVKGMALIIPVIIPNKSERTVPPFQIIVKDPDLTPQKLKMTPDMVKEFEFFQSFMVRQDGSTWDSYKKQFKDITPSPTNQKFFDTWQQSGYSFQSDLIKNTPIFSYPSLILTGRQDSIVGFKDAWSLIDKYPRATYAVLDQAGHDIDITKKIFLRDFVAEWLERVYQHLANAKVAFEPLMK